MADSYFLPPNIKRIPPAERTPEAPNSPRWRHFLWYWRGVSVVPGSDLAIENYSYQGGRWNGPLSAAEIAAITAAGYGARIRTIGASVLSARQSEFEGASGWQATGANCTTARSIAQARSGSASLAITAVALGDMEAYLPAPPQTGFPPVSPGEACSFTAWFRASVVDRAVRCQLWFYDVNGANLGGPAIGSSIVDTPTTWLKASVTGIAPSGSAYMTPGLYVVAPAGGEIHYADDLQLIRGGDVVDLPADIDS
jgi:hypothetical protein